MPPESNNSRIVISKGLNANQNKPVSNKKSRSDKYWSFSFKYFREIDYFGIGNKDISWFSSLLERLRDVSNLELERFTSDRSLQDAYRYHPINWSQKKIPIQRSEFYWLPKDILENDEEFPFYQFQISTAVGRVVGFWYEDIFYIIVLDPMHNIQPSKHYNYFVYSTKTVESDCSSLLADIDYLKKHICENEECKLKNELCKVPTKRYSENFYSFSLDDEYHILLSEKLKNKSITDIIQLGLLAD